MKHTLLVLFMLLVTCETSVSPLPHMLTVFAASSLAEAFTEIGQNFKTAHPDGAVEINFAGSQALRTQIDQGLQLMYSPPPMQGKWPYS